MLIRRCFTLINILASRMSKVTVDPRVTSNVKQNYINSPGLTMKSNFLPIERNIPVGKSPNIITTVL